MGAKYTVSYVQTVDRPDAIGAGQAQVPAGTRITGATKPATKKRALATYNDILRGAADTRSRYVSRAWVSRNGTTVEGPISRARGAEATAKQPALFGEEHAGFQLVSQEGEGRKVQIAKEVQQPLLHEGAGDGHGCPGRGAGFGGTVRQLVVVSARGEA